MKHFLSIETISAQDLAALVHRGIEWKTQRATSNELPLAGQTWAMIFSKASTRTRVSFEVGVRELGGNVMFLSTNDMQLGRGEPIKDTARVLGRMVHGCIIRTFDHADVEQFAHYGQIPTINALTDSEHPCQIVADLMSVVEELGTWQGKKIAFVGDGDNNVSRSWMWAAKLLGFEFVVATPEQYAVDASFLQRLQAPNVSVTHDVQAAVQGAHVINTDVWLSMGQEGQAEKEAAFAPYQVNQALLDMADSDCKVLHCLPAYRGKEITEEVLESQADVIFSQAENRLHAQKAVMEWLVK